jgi:hypothetical protein
MYRRHRSPPDGPDAPWTAHSILGLNLDLETAVHSLVGADQAYPDDLWTVTLMILTLPYWFNGLAEHLV